MKKYNCIIIDDDEIFRLSIASYAKRFPVLNIVGVYENANDLLNIINVSQIDVLFLDIDMVGLSGLEFRKKVLQIPVCIFITSHPEYAAESFELDTLDFIVKPIKFERFEQTMARIQDYLEIRYKAALFESSSANEEIFIKEGHKKTKIKPYEILYLEALQHYTKIVTNDNRYYVLSNIGSLMKEPHFSAFIRIHRSYAIQKQSIKEIATSEVLLTNNKSLPIGRNYKENINQML